MPIRPENLARYPADWPQISERIRAREGNRCKWCGAANGQPHPDTGSKVVLTVAHLDHQPENCADENLAALCQRCHNRYDGPERRRGIAERRHAARAIADLFAPEMTPCPANPAGSLKTTPAATSGHTSTAIADSNTSPNCNT